MLPSGVEGLNGKASDTAVGPGTDGRSLSSFTSMRTKDRAAAHCSALVISGFQSKSLVDLALLVGLIRLLHNESEVRPVPQWMQRKAQRKRYGRKA